ncbi:MAG: lipoate--protein ligase family protein [Candidatus Omnitrophica bacterium]|nr:lipoate--protein ligase family protein [Candidatus Omnitrophota bacterium]
MILKNLTFQTPEENLIYDDCLLHMTEKKSAGEFLRFWESAQTFIVLGRIGKAEKDVDEQKAQQDQVKVLRRSSGGGTVVQGKGCLNYSFILSKEKNKQLQDIHKSYQYILGAVIAALECLNIQCQYFPISDIALSADQRKFSGNAQKRGRNFILHHGTLLYNFDLSLIDRYLKMPEDKPAYRQNRSHLDFVTNIAIDPNAFKQQLKQRFPITKEEDQIGEEERLVMNNFLVTH